MICIVSPLIIYWFQTWKYTLLVFDFDGWVSWEKAIWWLAQSIWPQSSHLGRYRDPPLPSQAALKGVGSVEGEECGQIWAKFGPYIELWVNIPSLCGSHLGKMDPQASPNYAWQPAGGGSKCESSIKPLLVFHPHWVFFCTLFEYHPTTMCKLFYGN